MRPESPPHSRAPAPTSEAEMTNVLFAHRDFPYFAPKLQATFPQLEVTTAVDLPAAGALLPGADVIISVDHTFTDARLAAAHRLRWIQTMTTGTDALERSRTLRRNQRSVDLPCPTDEKRNRIGATAAVGTRTRRHCRSNAGATLPGKTVAAGGRLSSGRYC